ncbi:ATP-binding cassette domain-containing protein [Streptomyces sp. A012304]|uniref:ABC transporter ATP-binding protein n=1 Tax=Streptomyces sp. A012304 TaxID=375446 RepID=UPI00222FAEAB|nr:ATP-binding cassette domain-containing protein [Streptomyces sp. A012304]GKQ35574.1 ABC transporter [Streptomyces sp. A012304]
MLRVIQAFGLTSDHRKELPPALDDVTFEARAGRVTVLLGAPGAGKSTALRLMLELQQGRGITYFRGRPLHRIAHPSREVGVLLGDVPGHPARTVRGHLRMLCAAAGVPVRRADEVLEVVGLVSLSEERLGTLSRGMDRRLGLACALLADPHTLVLDEPTDGLSDRESRWVHGMLRAHAAQGGTVLSTTSDPKEAVRIADRVVSLDQGRLVADQEARDFARNRLRPRVAVRSPHAARLAALLVKEARTARRSVEVVQEDGNRLSVYGSTCAHVGETAFRHGVLVHQLADEVGDMGPGAGADPTDRTPTEEGTAPLGDEQQASLALLSAISQTSRESRSASAQALGEPREASACGHREPHAATGTAAEDTRTGSAARMAVSVGEPRTRDGGQGPAPASHASPDPLPGDSRPVDDEARTELSAAPPDTTTDTPDTPEAPEASEGPDTPDTSLDRDAARSAAEAQPAAAPQPRPRSAGEPTEPAEIPADSPHPSEDAASTPIAPPSTNGYDGIPAPTALDALSALPPPISVRPAPSPLRPLRYELRRATGISTGMVISAAVLLVSAVTALLLARIGHTPQARLLAAWPAELPLPPSALGAGLLGALAFGDEFRHPALAADRGTVPRRLGLLTAKLLVATLSALMLAFLTVGCDAEVLYLVYGREFAKVPADWLQLSASWAGLMVGCAWAGVLAAGVFRSTTAGLAAVVAVPVAVVPLVQKAVENTSVRTAAEISVRLRETFLMQWPFGGERYLAGVVRVIVQPVGGALALSLTLLMCAYLLTALRSRVR